MYFLWGLLGPNSIGFMKGKKARERRHLLHDVSSYLPPYSCIASSIYFHTYLPINYLPTNLPLQLFTTQKLDLLVPHFVECIRQLTAQWPQGEPFEVSLFTAS